MVSSSLGAGDGAGDFLGFGAKFANVVGVGFAFGWEFDDALSRQVHINVDVAHGGNALCFYPV